MTSSHAPLRHAGTALIAASLAFMAVFTYLASAFGYPDVLDRSAGEVLPSLVQGGERLRAVWFFYGALPLVFVFCGVASGRLLGRSAPALRALGVGAAVTAGVAMMAGLLRWPTIQWTLARHWNATPGQDQLALTALFDASNLFLGNLVGELVGELTLATWFATVAIAWRREGRRRFGNVGVAAAVVLAVSALRNITPLVDPIAEINNLTLPLWMIAMGVGFRRDGLRAAGERGVSRSGYGLGLPGGR